MVGPVVDSTGYLAQTFAEVVEDLAELSKRPPSDGGYGPGAATGSTAFLGRLLRITGEEFQTLEQGLQILDSHIDLDNAAGIMLDRHVAWFGGPLRNPAVAAAGDAAFSGSAAAIVANDFKFRQSDTLTAAETTDAATTLSAATAWAAATVYAAKALVKNDSPDRIYVCTVGGTSDGSGGPTGTGSAVIVDNTAQWLYVGDGTFAALINAQAETPAKLSPTAGSFDELVDTASSLTGVRNPDAWTPGTDDESDAAYRVRARTARGGTGAGNVESMFDAIAALDFITGVLVRSNRSSIIDALGDDPHSVHPIIWDPLILTAAQDQDVIDAIGTTLSAGIEPQGAETGTFTGPTSGLTETMAYDFATEVRVFLVLDLTVDALLYPADGDAQTSDIVEALVFTAGQDVEPLTIECAVLDGVAGITDAQAKLDTSPAPAVRQSITITDLQVVGTGSVNGIAEADITVNS